MSDNPDAPRNNPGGFRPDPDGAAPRPGLSVDEALAHLQRRRRQATNGSGANGVTQGQGESRTNGRGGPVGREAEASDDAADEPRRGNGANLSHQEYDDGLPPPPDLDNVGGDYGAEDQLGTEQGEGEDGEGDGEAQPDSLFTVQVGGEQRQVPLSELVNGYMRAQDYTRKSSQAAAVQQQFAEAFQQFSAVRGQLEQRLARFTTEAAREFEQPIDWVKLAQSNPMEWAEKRARFDALKEAEAEQGRLANVRSQEEMARKQEMLRLGNDVLMRAIPEWRDPGKRTQLQAELKDFARSVGYSEQELAGEILDPRYIVVFHDAMKFRKMNSRRVVPPKQDAPRAPMARGGQPQASGPSRRQQAAVETFSGAPTVDNALALLKTRHKLN